MALSLGYAASMEATVYGASGALSAAEQMHDSTESSQLLEASPSGPGASQELDETTRSDISERPSMEDVESETGSTGALETRSLKDHKGEVLQSVLNVDFALRLGAEIRCPAVCFCCSGQKRSLPLVFGAFVAPETCQGRMPSLIPSPSSLSLQLVFFGVVPSSSSGERPSRKKLA